MVERPAHDDVEDLQEALRLIICMLQFDGRHEVTDRDQAVLVVAADALGLDDPIPVIGLAR